MLRRIAFILPFLLIFGESKQLHHRREPKPEYDSTQHILKDVPIIEPLAAAPPIRGVRVDRSKITITCDGQTNAPCNTIIDGQPQTSWKYPADSKPHTFVIDLKTARNVNAIDIISTAGQAMKGHKVYLSTKANDLGQLVAYGTWYNDNAIKYSNFEPTLAQYITLLSVVDPKAPTTSFDIAELNVWSDEKFVSSPPGVGKWGPTIDFPIVPAGAWVDPATKKLITFSSFLHDGFNQGGTTGKTLTATWDGLTVSERLVDETQHDMFCPGMSFTVDGNMIITGGESADKVSVFNAATQNWTKLEPMKIDRGYQGQTTIADGRVFVIGGSWAPENSDWGNRTGEIFDPVKGVWTLLPGCDPSPVQTTEDWERGIRYDNHIWLLGWKKNFIFQAGPSQLMNWIDTTFPGKITSAGERKTGQTEDPDAMCGVATMYDARQGLILTTGGAASYKYWDDANRDKKLCYIPGTGDNTTDSKGQPIPECRRPAPSQVATNNSFIIQIGEPNVNVNVTPAGSGHMKYTRVFHHGVVLPDGNVFVVGGQQLGQGFTDQTPQLTPEMFIPSSSGSGSFKDMAPNSIVRVYHSWALLLPDATVMVGGGGLCGDGCNVNHLDAQIYTPQYLLTGAARPSIKSGPTGGIYPGSNFTITTDTLVSTASLIRYSGATHSLNNDQRRIPFTLKTTSTAAPFSYTITLDVDGGAAIPGYWMLFVLDSNGVPSLAQNVQILIAK